MYIKENIRYVRRRACRKGRKKKYIYNDEVTVNMAFLPPSFRLRFCVGLLDVMGR